MAIAFTRAAGILIGDLLRTEAVSQADGILFELTYGLYTLGPLIGPSMVLADFTPAVFAGYAPLTAQTTGAPYLNTTNELQLTTPVLQWIATGAGLPETIVGYYAWREGTPDLLILAESFDTGILLDQAGDGIAFLVNVIFNLTGHGNHTFMP